MLYHNSHTFIGVYLQVESFVIDQEDIVEETRLQSSKFLLSPEDTDHSVDPETQARLEALLQAAGKKHLTSYFT